MLTFNTDYTKRGDLFYIQKRLMCESELMREIVGVQFSSEQEYKFSDDISVRFDPTWRTMRHSVSQFAIQRSSETQNQNLADHIVKDGLMLEYCCELIHWILQIADRDESLTVSPEDILDHVPTDAKFMIMSSADANPLFRKHPPQEMNPRGNAALMYHGLLNGMRVYTSFMMNNNVIVGHSPDDSVGLAFCMTNPIEMFYDAITDENKFRSRHAVVKRPGGQSKSYFKTINTKEAK